MSMKAEAGQTVRVHYTGKLESGEVFDSSREADPIEFKLGAEMVIPGFEDAIIGMTEGEKKVVTVASSEGYGDVIPELIQEVSREAFPDDLELEVGLRVQAQNEEGELMDFVIANIEDEKVVVNGNHPLAGKDLTFDLELISIEG